MRVTRRIVEQVTIATVMVTALWVRPADAAAPPVRAQIDLLELRSGPGGAHLALESTFTAGSNLHQFALKVDGGSDSRVAFDRFQFQGLWMPQVAAGSTLAIGFRHDQGAASELSHAVAGGETEFAAWLAGEHYFYLSQHGDLTGGAKLVGRWPLGERLVFEPRIQLGWSAGSVPSQSLSRGLTDVQASLRLRREIGRNAGVYIGLVHTRLIGGTYSLAHSAGDTAVSTRAVTGFGLSF